MSTARALHTATALADGRVLAAGGSGATAEVYNPGSNSWTATGSMQRFRIQGNAVRLGDGRVLEVAGDGSCSVNGTSELYDPQTNTWALTGQMNVQRRTPGVTLLADGRVLAVGGEADCDFGTTRFASAEAYAPGSGTWSAVASMSTPRGLPLAVTLADGRVLVAGGYKEPEGRLASAELYDPATNSWSSAASMATPHYNGAATLLPDGRVLVVGGEAAASPLSYAGAETYDPVSDQWSPTGPMAAHRVQHRATLLSDGTVLVTGGFTSSGYTATSELYDPATNTWSSAGTMASARGNHASVALAGGGALITGGQSPSGTLADAEIYGMPTGPPPGFVTRDGTQLRLDGQPFRPIGLNVYNANSNGWCWYEMNGTILADSLTAMGPGKNAMRSWFFQQLATTNGQRDWTAFDRTLDTARARGVKVIATLADQWGDCGQTTIPGYGYKDKAWYESAYKTPDASVPVSYRDWVAEVVGRYKDDPAILAWQLVNEPEVLNAQGGDCSQVPESTALSVLSAFAADVAGLIKSIDPDHLVSLGTIGGGQCGAVNDDFATLMSTPTLDLCEYHDYTPNELVPGDQWNGLQRRVDQCNALDKPLLVGELGVKPSDVGGTLQARANRVDAKVCAQLSAGVAGVLPWAWSKDGSTLDNFDIGPNDPLLDVLTPWSNPAHTCSPPSAPTGVVAAAGDGTAAVSWVAPASNGSVVQAYRVTVSPGGQQWHFDAPATHGTIPLLTNGVAYTFTVAAVNGAGWGPDSGPSASVTPQSGNAQPAAASGVSSSSAPTTVATGTDPAQTGGTTTSVAVPAGTAGGAVSVTQSTSTESPPEGYTFGSIHVDVTAPSATPDNPLVLVFTMTPTAGQTPANTQIFRTEGGTTAPLVDCDPATQVPGPDYKHAIPDPCVWSKELVTIGGAGYVSATVLTSSASIWNAAAPVPFGVNVSDSGFTPRAAAFAFGGIARWSFTGKKAHSVTDSVGLGPGGSALFDSGMRTGGSYQFRFVAAGTYPYKSTVKGDTAHTGTVGVRALVSPATGSTATTFTVVWATTAPAGYGFDVRYRFRPVGSSAWRGWTAWKSGTTSVFASFVPTQGAGTYAFAVRLRNQATGRTSDWSPDTAVTVG